MKLLWGRIRKTLLYAGLEPDEFNAAQYNMRRVNRKMIIYLTGCVALAMIVLALVSVALPSNRIYLKGYLSVAAVMLVCYLIARFPGKEHLLITDILCYLFAAVIYSFGIYSGTIASPTELSVIFVALLAIIPLIFVDRPAHSISLMFLAAIVYIFMAYRYKPMDILESDVVDVCSFAFVGACLNMIVMSIRGRSEHLFQEAKTNNQRMKAQAEIAEALSRDYPDVVMVSLAEDRCVTVKRNGRILPTGERVPRYGYRETWEEYIQSFVVEEDRGELRFGIAPERVRRMVARDGGEYFVNYRIRYQDEVHCYQVVFCQLSASEGNDGQIVAAFRNVDAIVEEELRRQEVLQRALEDAEHANKAKTVFLNNMSHDIRTPMNAIIGFTALARKHLDQKEQVADYLGKIAASSEHLLSLINDVLDMSRIESGKVKLEESAVHLPEIIRGLRTIVQADADRKSLDLSVDTWDIRDEDIICDKLRLNQILLNLLSNAIKYTPAGGKVSLRVRQLPVGEDGQAIYEFRVRDNGIGMSEEFQRHLFEAFERERTATVSGIQGTGLGMSITRNLVEMMGGTIQVTSKVGEGSEFLVGIPFRLAETEDADRSASDAGTDSGESVTSRCDFTGRRVLLVEDNALNMEITTEILTEAGFLVDGVDDGDVAVETMQKAERGRYDLILMDVQMPRMNGYDATRQIRQIPDPELSGIPIIAMTANAFEEDRQRALEAGMNCHLSKPIEIDRLFETLEQILENDERKIS